MDASIALQSLSHTFPSSGLVLDRCTCNIPIGKRTTIVGPSGCGKSTLIRLLIGLEASKEAYLNYQGEQQPHLKAWGKSSFVFQEANLLPWRSVRDNITLPLELEKKQVQLDQVDQLITKVGLKGFADHVPSQLSGGMKMRVALARAMITKPDFLCLDEPFGALDTFTRERMGLELSSLWQDQRPTLIMITHNIEEAMLMSDHIIVMSGRPGRIILEREGFPSTEHGEDASSQPEYLSLKKNILSALRDEIS